MLCLLAIAFLGSYQITEINPALLFSAEARTNIGEFLLGMFPPDLSLDFLSFLIIPTLETLQISLMGMILAMGIGFPLALLATSTLTFSGVLNEYTSSSWPRRGMGIFFYSLARGLLNLFRAVPEFVWALMFVRAVGLGPFPGVLAIGIAYGGILGKIYAEILEEVNPQPLEALQATGASKLQILFYGILPQAFTHGLSYTLYRWECAIRAAAIMGFVGAGGIGQQLELSMRMFDYGQAMTCLLIILLLVMGVDYLSTLIQRHLLQLHSRERFTSPWGSILWGVVILGILCWSYRGTKIEPALLVGQEGRGQIIAFLAQLFPPDLSLTFLRTVTYASIETLAISFMGTLLAVGVAWSLALPAAQTLTVRGLLYSMEKEGTLHSSFRTLWYMLARLTLSILRSIPEIVWALIFILAVGLGPFAGVLALGIHNGGVLGKLYAEFLDAVNPKPVEAIQATGANKLQIFCYAILPQAFPLFLSYTLYRWEVIIRAAAILGLVGAGGIGTQIHIAISLFHYSQLLTLIGMIFLLVTLVDMLSGMIRRYWL